MPDIYRAPEVILGMAWDYKVDIWNVGMMVCYISHVCPALLFSLFPNIKRIWDLFEYSYLFEARNVDEELDDDCHLAETKAILGKPPLEFVSRCDESSFFWDADVIDSFPRMLLDTRFLTSSGQWKGVAPNSRL